MVREKQDQFCFLILVCTISQVFLCHYSLKAAAALCKSGFAHNSTPPSNLSRTPMSLFFAGSNDLR